MLQHQMVLLLLKLLWNCTAEQSKGATLMVWESIDCFLIASWNQHVGVMILLGHLPNSLKCPRMHMKQFSMAVKARCCTAGRSAGSFTLTNNLDMVCLVSRAVSTLLAMPSGTTAPVGSWSSGSVRVRYLRKIGGGHVFLVSNRKMKIQPAAPVFHYIPL